MFSFLGKEGAVALRLPSEAREAFLNRYKTAVSEQYGSVMKEYVVVPDGLLRKTEDLRRARPGGPLSDPKRTKSAGKQTLSPDVELVTQSGRGGCAPQT